MGTLIGEMRLAWDTLNGWLGTAPLGLLAVVVPAMMVAAVASGLALRAWADRTASGRGSAENTSLEGNVVSAVLGMMALLLAFTFSLAVDRFETRRALVLEEANAIGTVYLRTQLLQEPHRARLSAQLRDYTANRLLLAKAAPDAVPQLLARNDRLLTEMWAATMSAIPSVRDPGVSNAFVTSMNTMIDLDTSRKVARNVHVPSQVFLVLFIYLIVTAGVLGFVFVGHRGRLAAAVMLTLLTLFQLLVFDIDRPTSGAIQEDQRPMELLRASLASQPPAAFDIYLKEDAASALDPPAGLKAAGR